MTLAISCQNLVKRFPGRPPVEAVRGLDLAIEVGECFGLLGPNGAGKTTTIEMIEGLATATSGLVEVFGLRWGQNDLAIKQRMGISLQETKLSEKLTVEETVTLFRSFYPQGLSPEKAIRQVSLQEKARARVGKLSGGQRQRLAVACALVGNPDLLLLDEPTTGLDPQSRRQLWDLIREFKNQGRTVLLTTHYMDEAERLCDRVAIIDQGKVIALGSPRELISQLGGAHILTFTVNENLGRPPLRVEDLQGLSGMLSLRQEPDQFSLSVDEPHIALPALLHRLKDLGQELTSLSTRHASLEDVFVTLTGRHLRDGDAGS